MNHLYYHTRRVRHYLLKQNGIGLSVHAHADVYTITLDGQIEGLLINLSCSINNEGYNAILPDDKRLFLDVRQSDLFGALAEANGLVEDWVRDVGTVVDLALRADAELWASIRDEATPDAPNCDDEE